MADFAAQARREIRQAYRPAERQLSRQERRVRAQDKRMQKDERAYQNWLRSTNAALNAEAARRDSELAATEKQYDEQLRGSLDAAEQAATGRLQATGGPTPGAGGPAPAVPGVSVSRNVATAQSAAFGGRLGAQMRRGLGLSQSVEKNTYAAVAVQKAQRRAATMDALSKIAEARGDLAMKKAADVAKRVAEMEAAAAEAAQQAFENELAAARVAQGEARLSQADQRIALSEATAADMSRDRRARRRIARKRLALSERGGRSGGLPPVTRFNNQVKFDAALSAAVKRYNKARTGGERRVPHKGDTARLAQYLQGRGSSLPREVLEIAAHKALYGRVSAEARRRAAKYGVKV